MTRNEQKTATPPRGCPYDPLRPGHMSNPESTYEGLRTETPVYYSEKYDLWVISRYDDVIDAARDVATFSSRTPHTALQSLCDSAAAELEGVEYPLPPALLTLDPPDHDVHRKIVAARFTPRHVRDLEPFVRETVRELREAFIGRGSVELQQEYSTQLTMRVIAQVFGFATEELPILRRWSDSLMMGLSPNRSEAEQIDVAVNYREFYHRIIAEIRERRGATDESFLSILANARRADGDYLHDPEAVSVAQQAFIGGNETTNNLLGGSFILLAQDAVLCEKLRSHPETAIPPFVEEALRLVSPVQALYRVTTRDVDVSGVTIPTGSRVQLLWGSANRDQDEFEHAAKIDLDRDRIRRHLAFGFGSHFCVGAPLARLEATLTLEELLPAMRDLRPADDWTESWRDHFHLRGPESVALQFTPA